MTFLSIDVLRSAICFCEKSGEFKLAMNYGKRKAGSSCGSVNKINGYVEISVRGKKIYGHRAAWAIFYGEWPSVSIDHINGNRSDNRIENLRLAERSINSENIRLPKRNNTSGFLGVTFCRQTKRWIAQIVVSRNHKTLGRFDTPELAYSAYLNAKQSMHEGCTLKPTHGK